jgi:hypothetical protein
MPAVLAPASTTTPAKPDALAEEQEGDQRGEQYRHRVADRDHAGRRALRRPGEQREGNRGIDRADQRDARPEARRERGAVAPQEGQQHRGAQRQADFAQGERTEFRR